MVTGKVTNGYIPEGRILYFFKQFRRPDPKEQNPLVFVSKQNMY